MVDPVIATLVYSNCILTQGPGATDLVSSCKGGRSSRCYLGDVLQVLIHTYIHNNSRAPLTWPTHSTRVLSCKCLHGGRLGIVSSCIGRERRRSPIPPNSTSDRGVTVEVVNPTIATLVYSKWLHKGRVRLTWSPPAEVVNLVIATLVHTQRGPGWVTLTWSSPPPSEVINQVSATFVYSRASSCRGTHFTNRQATF